MPTGYFAGDQYFKAPEDTVPVSLALEPPYEGEIDTQLHIRLGSVPSPEELSGLASQICNSMLAYVNLSGRRLRLTAIPVAPMQIRRVKEGGSSQIENNFTIAVHNRATVTAELATRLVNAYSKNRAMKSPEQVRAIDVAALPHLANRSG